MATIMTMQLQLYKHEVRDGVIRLQNEAKNEFERESGKISKEVENLDEDGVETFVRGKFQNLNEMFLKNSKNVEELVISKKPKKPVRTPGESDEEYDKKYKAYKEDLSSYKAFVSWCMSLIGRLMTWLSELFDDIVAFFKNLWTWIKTKIRNISENIQEFVQKVVKKFNQLHDYLFGPPKN